MLHGHHSLPRFTENPTVCPYPLIPPFCSLYCNNERYSLIPPRATPTLSTHAKPKGGFSDQLVAMHSRGHALPLLFSPISETPNPGIRLEHFKLRLNEPFPRLTHGQVSSVEDSSFSSSSTILVSRSTLSSFVYSVSNRKRHNPRVEHRPMSFEEG